MTHRVRPSLAWFGATILVLGACASAPASPTPTPVPTGTPTGSSVAPSPDPSTSAVTSPGTAGHVRVRGTRVSMVPGPGFIPASTFAGFGHPSGAAIEVTEVPQPYAELAPQVTAEELATEGIQVDTRDTVTLGDGREALVLSGTQTIDGTDVQKIILVTGDDTSSVLITSNIPLTAPDDVEPMTLVMLLSTLLEGEG